MANTYRGKYPHRIKGVWQTTTRGVFACQANNGQRYFFSSKAAVAAGYKVTPAQLLGLNANELQFLKTSIAEASAEQWMPAFM